MSLSAFAKNFADALPAGIDLANQMEKQRGARTQRSLGEIMADLQSYDPFAEQADPTGQALPEPGQKESPANPNRGFDGKSFAELEAQYFRTAAGLGDPKAYAEAQQNFGTWKMNKINSYADFAVAAHDRGDFQAATKAMRAASAFMDPGVTPEVVYDPNTGAYGVMNYGEDGKPQAGYALTRDQILNIRGINTDFNAWAARDNDMKQHNDRMAIQRAQLAETRRANGAREALAGRADARAAELDKLAVINREIENASAALDLGINMATAGTAVARTNAENVSAGIDANLKTVESIRTSEGRVGRQTAEDEAARLRANAEAQTIRDQPREDWTIQAEDAFTGLITYEVDNGGGVDALGQPTDSEPRIRMDPYWAQVPAVRQTASVLMKDIYANNEEADPLGVALAVEGLLGPNGGTQYDADNGIIDTGLDRYQLSPDANERVMVTLAAVMKANGIEGGVPTRAAPPIAETPPAPPEFSETAPPQSSPAIPMPGPMVGSGLAAEPAPEVNALGVGTPTLGQSTPRRGTREVSRPEVTYGGPRGAGGDTGIPEPAPNDTRVSQPNAPQTTGPGTMENARALAQQIIAARSARERTQLLEGLSAVVPMLTPEQQVEIQRVLNGAAR